MNSVELFRKIAEKQKASKVTLLDDIDKVNDNYKEYYCANVVEKTFECNNKLIYKIGGGYGMNYRYCSNCYHNWDLLKAKNRQLEVKEEPIEVKEVNNQADKKRIIKRKSQNEYDILKNKYK